jgi:hypothetical protein
MHIRSPDRNAHPLPDGMTVHEPASDKVPTTTSIALDGPHVVTASTNLRSWLAGDLAYPLAATLIDVDAF